MEAQSAPLLKKAMACRPKARSNARLAGMQPHTPQRNPTRASTLWLMFCGKDRMLFLLSEHADRNAVHTVSMVRSSAQIGPDDFGPAIVTTIA
jgi:hypothetical protein